MAVDDVVDRVFDATVTAVHERPDWNWDAERRGLERMCTSWRKKHPEKPRRNGRTVTTRRPM
jgi:hypothetical protein